MATMMIIFALGIVNFAIHKAVLESGHPMLQQIPWFFELMGGRFSLLVEFLMLLGVMLLVDAGSLGWAWAYLIYSLIQGLSAWLILTGRV